MRKFKTAEKNCTNYVYYTAEGKPIVITPGMTGADGKAVTENLITMLHGWDDDDVDAERREEYHCLVHYESYHDGDGDDADDTTRSWRMKHTTLCSRFLLLSQKMSVPPVWQS